MHDIKTVCTKCNSSHVDIFSAIEDKLYIDDIDFPVINIKYICTDCGNMTTKTISFIKKGDE